MEYTTANKKITSSEHDLNEERPLMKHDTDTVIALSLRGAENCRDCSIDRFLKASSVQGYTGLVDTDETEAVDCRLPAGSDYPEKDGSGNPKYYWDCSPLSSSQSETSWSDYMNRVRSLTNMGQQLLHRLAARAENQRGGNPQDHAAQTPLGLDGPVSTIDTLRRPIGQEPQVNNQPHGSRNDNDVVPLSSVPRRLQFNASLIPRSRATTNNQRANVAAPPRGSRMDCPQPVSVPCGQQGPSAPQSRIPTSRIPQRRTCNEQATAAAAPPRRTRMNCPQPVPSNQGPSARQQPIIQRYRTAREQRAAAAAAAAPPRRTRMNCPQPVPSNQGPSARQQPIIQRYRTAREQRANAAAAAPPRRTRMNCPQPASVPSNQGPGAAPQQPYIQRYRTAREQRANAAAAAAPPRRTRMNCPQPASVPSNQGPGAAPQQPYIQRYRTAREQRANAAAAAAPPRRTRMNRPQPVSVPCVQQGPSAPQCRIPTSRIPSTRTCNGRGANVAAPPQRSRTNCPQPVSVPCDQGSSAPQCPIPTSDAPQCIASTSRHNEIYRDNEDDNAMAPCEMDNNRIPPELRCPNPNCSIPLSRARLPYDPDSPTQYEMRRLSMEQFLDECESSYMRPLTSPCENFESYVPQCPPPRQVTPVVQEQNDSIQISGTITLDASPEGPRTMEAQHCPEAAPQPSPPQCANPRPRCPHCPYSPDSLYRFLDRANDNDAAASPPRRLTPCSMHRPRQNQNPPIPNDFDSLVQFIDRVNDNDAAPAQQEQTRSIRISGSFNAQISAESTGIQGISPPDDFFDLDSDELDDEDNGC